MQDGVGGAANPQRAPGKCEPFMDHVRALLRQAGVLYADETPARAAGGLEYVHVACTEYLTVMHVGDRSAATIDVQIQGPRFNLGQFPQMPDGPDLPPGRTP